MFDNAMESPSTMELETMVYINICEKGFSFMIFALCIFP